jgi:hypothetical protein
MNDSRNGLLTDYEYLIYYTCVMMMISFMNSMYKEFLILFFSVDASKVTLANLTHMWIKGVIHIYHIDEGEMWKHPCHILLALPP